VKRYLAPVAAALAISLVASVASAQALTFQRVCKYSFGTTTDGRWTTVPPYYIHITARADSYIAAHAGMVEGRPVFNKPSHQVPCSVAESVSHKAIRAWEGWARDTGNVGVTDFDDRYRPYLGRFYCTGQTYPTAQSANGRTYETCTHTGVHVGTIVVKFVIDATP